MSSMGLCGAVIVMCCNDKTHEIRLSLLEAKIADRGASNESRVVVVVVDVALLILLLLLIIRRLNIREQHQQICLESRRLGGI